MRIAVVVPCFKVKSRVLEVLAGIGSEVGLIFVVDDCCPEQSGRFVEEQCSDRRVRVLFHARNQGVGGAVLTGYAAALAEKMDIVVKIDGDGQMDPSLIPRLVRPIIERRADYTKGSRFYSLESLETMPRLRKFGNSVLSFVNKVSSGYWNIMDPTNGYTAIHRQVLSMLPVNKLARRYFFESDMLFRLGTIRAVVKDIPMDARYGDEVSNLKIGRVLFEFPALYLKCFVKRLVYLYFLRDFNSASLEMLFGAVLMAGGGIFGGFHWLDSIATGRPATAGTVMLSVLPIIMGFQLLLSAMAFDINNVPREPFSYYADEGSDFQS